MRAVEGESSRGSVTDPASEFAAGLARGEDLLRSDLIILSM